jgi:hypothetical protein
MMPGWTYTGTQLETADTAKENLQLIEISSTRRDGRKKPYARVWRTESAGPSHFHA